MQLQFYFDLNCVPVCERVNVGGICFFYLEGKKTKQERKLYQPSSLLGRRFLGRRLDLLGGRLLGGRLLGGRLLGGRLLGGRLLGGRLLGGRLLGRRLLGRLKGNRKGIVVKGKEFYIPILNTFSHKITRTQGVTLYKIGMKNEKLKIITELSQ